MLTILTNTVDLLVGASGLITWLLFAPQIRLLLKQKRSDSISLGLMWGSWGLQSLVLTQAFLHQNWALALTMGVSVLSLSVTNYLIHYYRRFPGGCS